MAPTLANIFIVKRKILFVIIPNLTIAHKAELEVFYIHEYLKHYHRISFIKHILSYRVKKQRNCSIYTNVTKSSVSWYFQRVSKTYKNMKWKRRKNIFFVKLRQQFSNRWFLELKKLRHTESRCLLLWDYFFKGSVNIFLVEFRFRF